MLDAYVRPYIDPPLKWGAQKLSATGISANMATIAGFAFGAIAMWNISQGYYGVGALFILMNRLMDGLDGAIAGIRGITAFGGFLDISVDFIIYAGIIFAFAWAKPESALWAAFLIFSYMGPMVTFLAYAILAEKKGIQTSLRGTKSFFYVGGLCEGTETALTMIILCLYPEWLKEICVIYGALCWLTTGGRILSAWELSQA